MPRLTMDQPHSLGQEEATRRLKETFSVVKTTYESQVSELHEEWNDHALSFGFKVMGMKIAGTVAVEESAVKVGADLPLAAAMFRGTIEKRIKEELDQLLA